MTKQITRAGYEYQDLVAIQELLLFLDDSHLYDNVRLEYNNEGKYKYLDDVVCNYTILKNINLYK